MRLNIQFYYKLSQWVAFPRELRTPGPILRTKLTHSQSDSQLISQYYKTMVFLKTSNFFQQQTLLLEQSIKQYAQGYGNAINERYKAIESVHKLHPLEYSNFAKLPPPSGNDLNCQNLAGKVDKIWLLKACLRQQKFVGDVRLEHMKYYFCYREYAQFLYLCFKNPQTVIVPNRIADFMWHSHMQDHQAYRKDHLTMFNRVLNHRDDFEEAELKQHAENTQKIKKELLPPQQGSYMFIDYGILARSNGAPVFKRNRAANKGKRGGPIGNLGSERNRGNQSNLGGGGNQGTRGNLGDAGNKENQGNLVDGDYEDFQVYEGYEVYGGNQVYQGNQGYQGYPGYVGSAGGAVGGDVGGGDVGGGDVGCGGDGECGGDGGCGGGCGGS